MIAKEILLSLIVGIGFVTTVIVIQSILGSVVGVSMSAMPIEELVGGVYNLDIALFIIAFVSLAITGVLVYVWVKLRARIAPLIGLQKKQTPKLNTKPKVALVLTFVGIAIVTAVVFYGFEQAIIGIDPNARIVDVQSFINALTGQAYVAVAGYLAMFIILGGLIIPLLGRWFVPVEHVAEKLTKNH